MRALGRSQYIVLSVVLLLAAGGATALFLLAGRPETRAVRAPVFCRAELRSWVVAGWGRHLFLDIECPPEAGGVRERVEFTTVMLRADYEFWRDASRAPRLGKMKGGEVRPPSFAPPPDNRLEAVYLLTAEQVQCLRRDRVFRAEYMLFGPNSNGALRRACEQCGVTLPEAVLAGGGALGQFPGIDVDPGLELPEESWASFGMGPGR
ncbi:MAG: hypothetical protein SFZ24_06840 [Planctomycetota bacterium]|nr:hypothetical protein [Planctomycetota bacterium]